MPQKTFFNLSDDKRNLIISAAIEEFSQANYNTASINQICKSSNIAKGSFYQYFVDKLDLYVYIMTLAIEEKISFFSTILAEFNSLTLLEQIRLLFIKGIEFGKKHPLYAALGEQFSKEDDPTAKNAVMKEGDRQSESLFIQIIETAKSKGEIDSTTDPLALTMILQSLNNSVNEYMLNKYGKAKYEDYEQEVNDFIESLLTIIFKGIENKL